MQDDQKPRARRREPLTKERIVDGALELADSIGAGAAGSDAISMRKVADHLGYGVMSLYNHVANKDELIVAMVDRVVAEIELPDIDTTHWREALTQISTAAHDVLLAHPWACTEWTTRVPGPHRIDVMEAILAALTDAGFSDDLVYHGYHAVTMHIVGFTMQEQSYQSSGQGALADLIGEFFADFPVERYPHLTQHVRDHIHGGHDDDFRVVLDIILDGLQRSLTE